MSSSSSVEQIKSKLDIVTLVSSYITLERAGGNFKGRCPFHNEKTPSFFVSPERNSYYCFGCHAKGDIFTFVQEFEGVDFLGSLKMLAERTGVKLEQYQGEHKSDKERLFGVLEQAVFFFQKNLASDDGAQAREYLEKRGVTKETVESFRVGWAPLEWRVLYEFLKSKNVTEADMLAVGLIKKKDGLAGVVSSLGANGMASYYDTFRGRIMFPIADSSGRVCGFSGRILVADDKSPKYLNSPETEVFNKSEILFGLDKAKKDIRVRDYSILVEGQMDLVMLHQAGFTNAVASSGTALTAEHLTKLRRLSSRIIMAYDGDNAGLAASDRSAKLALSLGMELKIAQMPLGKDPADMVKENPKELVDIMKGAKHIIDFYTDSLLARGLSGRELGKEIKNHVLPYVALLTSSIEKAHFIKSIAQKMFIKEEPLWEDLKHVVVPQVENEISDTTAKKPRVDGMEKRIIGMILWQKSLETPAVDVTDVEAQTREILKERYDELLQTLEVDKDSLLFETESQYTDTAHIISDVRELLRRLEEEELKRQLTAMMTLLQKAEQTRDSGEVMKYLEECQRLSGRINELKFGQK